MRLVSADGTVFDLVVESYQFPKSASRSEDRDWDANWLIVRGGLELPDGRGQDFRDPCLTTWEAREFGAWLSAIADGSVNPSPDRGEDQLDVVFTEPCLAFDLEDQSTDTSTIRVYLSLEAEPPFVVKGSAGLFNNFVRLEIRTEQLAAAVDAWHRELSEFPAR